MSARRTRFYLDKQHAKVLGVCAGIADYTGIDSIFVRIGVVVLTLLTFPWLADAKPRELTELDAEETRFWQGVRNSPRRSVREVHSQFRDIDRRLADIEAPVTSSGAPLAREIDSLR